MKDIDFFIKNRELSIGDRYLNLRFFTFSNKFIGQNKQIKLPDFLSYDKMGLDIVFTILNYFKFLQYVFEDCEVIDTQESSSVGHPDFIIKKENEELYLELKYNNDSIHEKQLFWFFKNSEVKLSAILFLDNIIKKTEFIKQIQEENKEEITENDISGNDLSDEEFSKIVDSLNLQPTKKRNFSYKDSKKIFDSV